MFQATLEDIIIPSDYQSTITELRTTIESLGYHEQEWFHMEQSSMVLHTNHERAAPFSPPLSDHHTLVNTIQQQQAVILSNTELAVAEAIKRKPPPSHTGTTTDIDEPTTTTYMGALKHTEAP
jgi:hypothetical protein